MSERERRTGARSTMSQAPHDHAVRTSALPIVALWVPALGTEVFVPQRPGEMTIGSAPDCDVVVNHPQVSRRHALVEHRSGGALELRDVGSKNGIEVNGTRRRRVEIHEGTHVKLGEVRALAMNEPMRVARRRLEFYQGFAGSPAELAVAAAASDTSCLLVAGPGCDAQAVARSYATASPRCDAAFEVFDGKMSDTDAAARVERARRGVAFVDGGGLEAMSAPDRTRLLGRLCSPAANVLVVFAAPDEVFAAARLGHDRLLYLHKVRIPSVAQRVAADELPLLFDRAFEQIGVGFTHHDLDGGARHRRGAGNGPNLLRLCAHDWPENYEELRLCAIYVKGKLTGATERQIAEEMGRSRGGMLSLARRWNLDLPAVR